MKKYTITYIVVLILNDKNIDFIFIFITYSFIKIIKYIIRKESLNKSKINIIYYKVKRELQVNK